MNVQDLVLNLEAAGFEADGIEEYLACWRMGDIKEQLTLLSRQRAVILDRLHREEKQIDCLDYLVYQIGKRQSVSLACDGRRTGRERNIMKRIQQQTLDQERAPVWE